MLNTFTRLAVLSALVTSFASVSSTASAQAAVDSREARSVRGYVVQGELSLSTAGESSMREGWGITTDGESATIELAGVAQATSMERGLLAFASKPLSTATLQLRANAGAQRAIELDELSVALIDGKWSVLAQGEFEGRPVFELAGGDATNAPRECEEFVVTGELQLTATALRRLGLDSSSARSVGMLTLIATPCFDPATPIVASAPAPAVGSGPDVVGSAVGPALSGFGSVGSLGAYAATMTHCNIGTSDAIWLDSGAQANQHPVFGTQMYRLKTVAGATRFEQLGMSWLVHGFCAADAADCIALGPPGSVFAPNGTCDWLGPFATNTHSASFNGAQHNMGARSEVDPWTGAFPYPSVLGGGASGDAIYKRLQIELADLDPAQNGGATYWTEVVNVCTDEPDAHRVNNYSVRQTLVGPFSGGQYNLSLTGSSYPMQTAIERWAAIDAGVALSYVDVPGDGRLYLGRKVTDLGGGQRHYEYALFNMNSDRGAQAVSIPLGGGASTSNLEFNDVDYHSGEPYSLADWSASVVPGASVAWSTQPYASDPDANALRWSTLYNFRFDSNAAPVTGDVTVTLFKPGATATVTFSNVEVPGSACTSAAYCTTSTTSNGCNPSMSGSGTASASAASGFTIACNAVDGARTGLIFFGTFPVAVPWVGGSTSTRCVDSPVQRTPVSLSGGTPGACDGTFTLDWNSWRAAHPGGLGSPYSGGQTLYAQTWFRDSAAPGGTNLSDGLSFTLCD